MCFDDGHDFLDGGPSIAMLSVGKKHCWTLEVLEVLEAAARDTSLRQGALRTYRVFSCENYVAINLSGFGLQSQLFDIDFLLQNLNTPKENIWEHLVKSTEGQHKFRNHTYIVKMVDFGRNPLILGPLLYFMATCLRGTTEEWTFHWLPLNSEPELFRQACRYDCWRCNPVKTEDTQLTQMA